MLSSELQHFHPDSTAPLGDKTLMHAERFQMANRIMCLEMLVKLNLFQLMERHRFWDSFLISIYRIDAYDLKNGNAHVREWWKNALYLSINPA